MSRNQIILETQARVNTKINQVFAKMEKCTGLIIYHSVDAC